MGSHGRTSAADSPGVAGPAGWPGAPPEGRHGAGPGRAGGRAARRKAARRVERRRRRSVVKEVPILIAVALLIALVLKTFLVQAFVIPSGSMEQTIRIGDRVLVDKLTPWFGSRPARGDVVVFKDPGGWLEGEETKAGPDPVGVKQVKQALTFIGLLPSADEQDLIKRVIGTGGDTVKCCDANGKITVNGTPLDEPYVNPGNPPSKLEFTVRVPEGRLFVMGDHRSNSADSRYHLDGPGQGTVPEKLVVGRAAVIAWPLGHWRSLSEPDTFVSVGDAPRAGARAADSPNSVSPMDQNGSIQLPTPAELPLVMGVVGLRRMYDRQQSGERSGCGGLGGRRTFRSRRAREATRGARRG
ncbi:signal peptidase I [Streptomyces sp. HU2014]|uniref:signal peptidase I n=1 Tax=Streptomyces TaxID=1883 RepID=UPI000B440F46|nr:MULTISPECIES: signal peptidase I [Streptomyces]UQI47649.1 signal peptidase I [Streptomyces sp. HU2014]